jgi:hypothetical protein
MSSLLCPLCGQRNDSTGHTCWVQTIAPTAWNNHHDIRTDNTAVIQALEARIAELEKVAEAAVIVCQLVDEKSSMVYGLLERPLKAAGYLGVGDE